MHIEYVEKESGEIQFSCMSHDAWVHKKCSEIKGRLVDTPDFKCHRCLGLAYPVDGWPVEHATLWNQKLDIVESPLSWR